MRNFLRCFGVVIFAAVFPLCLCAAPKSTEEIKLTSIKDSYQGLIDSIGVGFDCNQLKQEKTAYLVQVNFSSLTSSSELRADSVLNIKPSRFVSFTALDGNSYDVPFQINEKPINDVLQKAKEVHTTLRIHPLIWHEHFPAWFFYEDFDTSKAYVDQATMNARIEWYITSFVNAVRKWEKSGARGIKVVESWDVASEIYIDNGKLRDKNSSAWSAIYKDESYVVLAYKIVAGLAKEDEKIVYSDSNLHLAKKRDAVIKLLGLIKKAGGRVDEVGVISHLTADWPSRKDYFAALKTIAKQNVSIHISQLDIAPAGSKNIADCYADFMGQVLENKSIISGVSFRKLVKNSEKTYIDSMRGPLFDLDFSPNDSYFSILKAAEKYKK